MNKEYIMLFISAILDSINGKNPIKLEGNGYVDLVISVKDNGESPDEIDQLVSGLPVLFNKGSHQLYMSTRKTFYLKRVTILLPSSWQPSIWQPSGLYYDQAHIRIEKVDKNASFSAFAKRDSECGVAMGEMGFMLMSKDLVKNAIKNLTTNRIFAKVLVHEFSHMQYGIFDEYPTDSDFYEKDGKMLPTQCPENLKVKKIKNCEPSLWNRHCEIVEHSNESQYASLMYRAHLEEVTEFCDNDPSNPNTLHNMYAPTEQNRLCDNRSVWEVIRDHQDYKDVVNSKEENIHPPPSTTINIVRRSVERAVLVFDISGSMTECKISLLSQIVKQHFQYIVGNVQYVGVVWFSERAFVKTTYLWQIDKILLPNELDSFIPKNGSGGTSIGAGILAALALLKQHPDLKGGHIYVVTDGEENTQPYIEDISQQVKEYDAVVFFHITKAAMGVNDNQRDYFKLAQVTGGYVIHNPFCQAEIAGLKEVFYKITALDTASLDLVFQNEVRDIKRHRHVVKYTVEYTPIKGSVFIEENLGRDTLFEFRPAWWKDKANISWIIVSPNGKKYNKSSPCYNDTGDIFQTHICLIKDQHFQPGMWRYEVMSKESVAVITLVQSKWTKRGKLPVMMIAFWDKTYLSIKPEGKNKRQRIVVDFNLGEAMTKPVLYAEVIAKVTTPTRRVITVYPNDDGQDGDGMEHDGIYNAYFYSFDKDGMYDLLVYGKGKNNTVGLHRECSFAKGWYEIAPRYLTGPVTRVNYGRQFHLTISKPSGGLFYAPAPIMDLQIIRTSEINRTIQVTWTAVGAQLYDGTASFYDIRIGNSLDSFSLRKKMFHAQMKVTQDMIVDGVNLMSPSPPGETEMATIKLPSNVTSAYINIVAATSYKNKTLYGKNGLTKYFSLDKKEKDGTSSSVQPTKPLETRTSLSNTEEPSTKTQGKATNSDQTLIRNTVKPYTHTAKPPPLSHEAKPPPLTQTAKPPPLTQTAKPPALRNTAEPSPGHTGKLNAGIISGLAIGCVTLVIILTGSVVWIVKKKAEHRGETTDESEVEIGKDIV